MILVYKTLRSRADKIFFAKVEKDGFDLGDNRSPIDENDLPRISKAINEYCVGFNNYDPILKYLSKKEILDSNDLGLTYERYVSAENSNTHFDYVKLMDLCKIDWGNTSLTKKSYSDCGDYIGVSAAGPDGKMDFFEYEGGKVVISAIGANCGKVFYIKKKFTAIKNTIVLHDYSPKCAPKFLFFLFNKNIFPKRGGGQPFISKGDTSSVKIPLPSLEIQKDIVEELEQYQKVIDGAKQVVENYKPHFEIDESWDQIQIKNIGIVNKSTYKYFEEEEYTYIDVSSVGKGNGLIDHSNIIKSSDLPSRAKRKIKKGSLIISSVRPNLKGFSIIDFKPKNHVVSTGFMVLDVNEKYDNRFIYYSFYTKNVMNQMIARMGKGSYPSINQADFKELSLYIPPLEHQIKIADRLDNEFSIVRSNKKLIEVFAKKIEDRINKIWGE